MIVLGLMAVAAALSVPLLGQFTNSNRHATAVQSVVQSLRNAKTFAQTGNEYVGLGIREGIQFTGGKQFWTRDRSKDQEQFVLSSNDSIQGSRYVTFQCSSGLPVNGAQTTYVVDDVTGRTTTIYIDANGGLSVQDGSGSSVVPGGIAAIRPLDPTAGGCDSDIEKPCDPDANLPPLGPECVYTCQGMSWIPQCTGSSASSVASSDASSLSSSESNPVCPAGNMYAGAPDSALADNLLYTRNGSTWESNATIDNWYLATGQVSHGPSYLTVHNNELYGADDTQVYQCTPTGWQANGPDMGGGIKFLADVNGSLVAAAQPHIMWQGQVCLGVDAKIQCGASIVGDLTSGNNVVKSMAVLNNELYVGLGDMYDDLNGDGAQVWKYDGASWSLIGEGADLDFQGSILALIAYHDELYVGGGGGFIGKYTDGVGWQNITPTPQPGEIDKFDIYNDQLYAATIGNSCLLPPPSSSASSQGNICGQPYYDCDNLLPEIGQVATCNWYSDNPFPPYDCASPSDRCSQMCVNFCYRHPSEPVCSGFFAMTRRPKNDSIADLLAVPKAFGANQSIGASSAAASVSTNGTTGTTGTSGTTGIGNCTPTTDGGVLQYSGFGNQWTKQADLGSVQRGAIAAWPSESPFADSCANPVPVPKASLSSALAATDTWVTNGPVYAMTQTGGTLYLGGQFTAVGPNTGHGVPLQTGGSSDPVATYPKVNGDVYSAISDGAGGWYIGGLFTKVGNAAHTNIAHIKSDGTVDSAWTASTDGAVRALALAGPSLYIGGEFTKVNGASRAYAAALNATGADTGFTFDIRRTVRAIAVSGGNVYIGGDFTIADGGVNANNLAVYDLAGVFQDDGGIGSSFDVGDSVYAIAFNGADRFVGAVNKFIKNTDAPVITGGSVRDFAFDSTYAYVALSLDGEAGSYATTHTLLRANAVTTLIDATWNPVPVDAVHFATQGVDSLTYDSGSSILYIGGTFLHVKNQVRRSLAALNTATDTLTSWNPKPVDTVYALSFQSGTVYAGGTFTTIGSQVAMRRGAAAIDVVSDTLLSWNPSFTQTGSYVSAIAAYGSKIYLGGEFSSDIYAQNVGSYDAVSGASDPSWTVATTANSPVNALVATPTALYVGGDFSSIGYIIAGVPSGFVSRTGLAALSLDGSSILPWDAQLNDRVTSLAAKDCTLFVGGYFTSVAGQARNYAASLHKDTAALTSWNPGFDSWVTAITTNKTDVFFGGLFNSINGQVRRGLASFGLSSGQLRSFNPSPDATVWSLAASGSLLYVGGDFSLIGNQSHPYLAALDSRTGVASNWSPAPDARVTSVVTLKNAVFAGGNFSGLDLTGYPKSFVAKIDGSQPVTTTNSSTSAASSINACKSWANDYTYHPSVSHDGRYITFDSKATNLVVESTNGVSQIYMKDVSIGTVSLISKVGSVAGNGDSTVPTMTPDGQYIVFMSSSSNLVPGSAPGINVYRYTVATGILELVNTRSNGSNADNAGKISEQSVSDDGRYIVFYSQATDLVGGANPSGTFWHAYVKDMTNGAVTHVDQSEKVTDVKISGDGKFVAFKALVTASRFDLLRWDATTLAVTRVNEAFGGGDPTAAAGVAQVNSFSISTSGRFISFKSDANNLEPSSFAGALYLRDMATATTTIASVSSSGASAGVMFGFMSADAKFVVFTTYENSTGWLYKRNLATGTTTQLTIIGNFLFDEQGMQINDDGSIVAFGNYRSFRTDALATWMGPNGTSGNYNTHTLCNSASQPVTSFDEGKCIQYAPGVRDMIDNRNVNGFSMLGLSWDNHPAGYLGYSYKAFVNQSEETSNANWCFRDVPPGNYEVRATWPAFFNAPLLSSFTVFSGSTLPVSTVTVNQKNDPQGPVLSSTKWETIGVFSVANMIRIKLSNKATPNAFPTYSGQVVADAIMLVPAAGNSSNSSAAGALAISNISITNVSPDTATVNWTTNEAATTLVDYGPTAAYGNFRPTAQPTVVSVNHTVILTGLTPGSTYHYKVTSGNLTSGTVASGDLTFNTPPIPSACTPTFNTTGATSGTWEANGDVYSIARLGNTVYVAGLFTSISGQPHNGLAALDAVTGAPRAVDFAVNGGVKGMVLSGSVLYIAGNFNQVAGQSRNCLAAISVTGVLLPWNPNAGAEVTNLRKGKNTVYAMGAFGTINGVPRLGFAAIDGISGALDGLTLSTSGGKIKDVAEADSLLYVAGDFSEITTSVDPGNPAVRDGVAAINLADSTFASWGLAIPDRDVKTILMSGATILIGGSFETVNGTARNNVAAVNASGNLQTWNPNADGPVNSIAIRNPAAYLGGCLASVNGQVMPISKVLSVDTNLGNYTGWNPKVEGGCVNTVLATNGIIYAGGLFNQVAGQAHKNLVALSAITASVDTVPPAITNVAATNITGNSATITWNTNELADSQVEYGVTTTYGNSTQLPTGLVTGHNRGLSGLTAQTTYHYRVKSRDLAGNLSVSGDYTFTTIDVTPPVISNVLATNITGNSATITWNTNEASDSQVEYGLSASYGQSTTINTLPVTAHSTALTGLQSYTTYNYRVKSKDAAGNLAVSANYTFRTADVTPPVISNVVATNITGISTIITWNTNEVADSQVDYGTTAAYGTTTPLNSSPVTSHSESITGLLNNTLYHYRVRSKDPAGNVSVSGDYTFTTLDMVAPIISNVTITAIGATTATIEWDTDKLADRQVQFGHATDYIAPGSPTTLPTSLGLHHVVNLVSLDPGSLYHFRVRSADASSNIALSADYTLTTQSLVLSELDGFGMDGAVYSTFHLGNTTYVGGDFSKIGPYTGRGISVDPTTANAVSAYPKFDHPLSAATSDGAGGWYVAVNTTGFGPLAGYLTHILANGTIDTTWAPTWSGVANTIIYDSSRSAVFVAGKGSAGLKKGLVAFDKTTGAALGHFSTLQNLPCIDLSPNVEAIVTRGTKFVASYCGRVAVIDINGAEDPAFSVLSLPAFNTVFRIVSSSPTGPIYLAGNFTSISGQSVKNLVKVTPSGTLDPWDPAVGHDMNWYAGSPNDNPEVRDIILNGTTLYVAGNFAQIGGQTRSGLAAFDTTTNALLSWNPAPNYVVTKMALNGSHLYIAGLFTQVSSSSRPGFADIDPTSGAVKTWNPDAAPRGLQSNQYSFEQIPLVEFNGTSVFMSGHFTTVRPQSRHYLAAFDTTTKTLLPWNPGSIFIYQGGSTTAVYALTAHGSKVYAGVGLNGLYAFDAISGARIVSWNPPIPNSYVTSLVTDGTTVYAGGYFTSVAGGVSYPRNLAASFSASNGTVTSWNPNVFGYAVSSLHLYGGTTVYIGGQFTKVGGQNHTGIAAVDATTGVVSSWNPQVAIRPQTLYGNLAIGNQSVIVKGSSLITGGNFLSVGGQSRKHVASMNILTGLVDAFFAPDINQPDTNFSPIRSISLNGSTLFMAGSFTTINGVSRMNVGAVDINTGATSTWTPIAGGYSTYPYLMYAQQDNNLYIGDFMRLRWLKY
ncbi:MAG: fibronectin type III domain-containing protein [Candidatus Peribacteraceae bacterium]|nr:fibronectin type III domain-containing protein [Candidatus Peribacteraceae bacterium]